VTVAGILVSNVKDVGQRWRGPSWKTWLVSGYAAQASAGASAAQVLVGCHCISASMASQTVSHVLTGRVSKYLTSYSRRLIPPLLHVAHTLHTPIPLLSPRGKCTGPADGLRAGVQSRLGSCQKRTNEPNDNFQTIKCRMMKLGDHVHHTKISPEFQFGVIGPPLGLRTPKAPQNVAVCWVIMQKVNKWMWAWQASAPCHHIRQ